MTAEEKEKLLQAIEDCGAAEMPLEETCLICQIDEDLFLHDKNLVLAYKVGQLRTKMQIRQAVVKMAREGVPQMVKIYQDFVKTELPDISSPEDDFDDDLPDLETGKDDK